MHDVTNNAPGARTFQVKQGKGGCRTVELIPGSTQTLDLVDVNHPVLKAWADTKEVTFTEVQPAAAPAKA